MQRQNDKRLNHIFITIKVFMQQHLDELQRMQNYAVLMNTSASCITAGVYRKMYFKLYFEYYLVR